MVGSTRLLSSEIKIPATAARPEPMKKFRYRTLMVSIPKDFAISESSTVARHAIPIRVFWDR